MYLLGSITPLVSEGKGSIPTIAPRWASVYFDLKLCSPVNVVTLRDTLRADMSKTTFAYLSHAYQGPMGGV